MFINNIAIQKPLSASVCKPIFSLSSLTTPSKQEIKRNALFYTGYNQYQFCSISKEVYNEHWGIIFEDTSKMCFWKWHAHIKAFWLIDSRSLTRYLIEFQTSKAYYSRRCKQPLKYAVLLACFKVSFRGLIIAYKVVSTSFSSNVIIYYNNNVIFFCTTIINELL